MSGILFLISSFCFPISRAARAQLPAGTPTYRVNAQWVTDMGSQVYNARAFGAKCDGVTDDAAAIQTAIDAANPDSYTQPGTGVVLIPGGCAIGTTLNVKGTLTGIGTGSPTKTGANSYLKWIGAASQPMLRIGYWKTAVRDLRLYGNTTNLPSEAILFDNTPGHYADHDSLAHISIGTYVGGSGPTGPQFVNGISWNGTTGGDSMLLQDIHISNVTGACMNNPTNGNASDIQVDGLYVDNCGTGYVNQGFVTGSNWEFTTNGVDLVTGQVGGGTFGAFLIKGWVGGNSTQFIKMYSGSINIHGGGYQLSASLGSPAIDMSAQNGAQLTLRDFSFQNNGVPTTWPTIAGCSTLSSGDANTNLTLLNVTGLRPTDITCVPTSGIGELYAKEVEFKGALGTGGQSIYARNLLGVESAIPPSNIPSQIPASWDWRRYDLQHEFDLWGGPLVLHQIDHPDRDPLACTPTGGSGTTYGYKVTSITTTGYFTGETTPSAEFTCSNAATLDSSHYNTIRIPPVLGATGAKVYGRTPSGELYMATVWFSGTPTANAGYYYWKDDGSISPSGALPTTNTTGRLIGVNTHKNASGWYFEQTPYLDIGADGHGGFVNTWAAINTVTFSSTPTFDASLGNTQKITLTGNVTSSTFTNCQAGAFIAFDIVEDGTGGRTFVWPTNIKGGGSITTTANYHNRQQFYCDGTNAWSTGAIQSGI